MMLKLFVGLAIENAVQPVDKEKHADGTFPQFYAFSPLNNRLDHGGGPLSRDNATPPAPNSAGIDLYGAVHIMHTFC